ncbi:MAG: Xaa-Pro peptidase family protein [Thermodesulfobacteriota bacterium]
MLETVPSDEISARVTPFQARLAEAGIGLGLMRLPADLFYYTGTVVDGFLAVPATGSPLLLVRRPKERLAAMETPWNLAFYQDLKELPTLLAESYPPWEGALGLELDVMPAALYRRLKEKLFPETPIQDLSPLIRRQRMVKSAYEIEQIRRAAAILDGAFAGAPEIIRAGLSELELAAALEYRLRLLGHQGLVRLRGWEMEMFIGHVLSGTAGLHLAYTDTPSGGLGFSPAFPQGASLKKLAPGEPISIDLGACYHGYVADMTRMYALESLPDRAWQAWDLILELFHRFEAEARPGVPPGELYQRLWEIVRQRGWEEYFMGLGPDRVSFLGHGVGLELNEYPFITARSPFTLEADMVLAFEPKFFLPEIGMIGLEDTGRITPQGVEWLTQTPRRVFIV